MRVGQGGGGRVEGLFDDQRKALWKKGFRLIGITDRRKGESRAET